MFSVQQEGLGGVMPLGDHSKHYTTMALLLNTKHYTIKALLMITLYITPPRPC
jgi:hypothetical protein